MPIARRFRGLRLLGRARPDRRREVIDLLAAPTDSLLCIKRKGNANHLLSRAEWTVVAHFAQQGLETVPMTGPSRVSTDSLMAVVDAFAAVHDLRTVAITGRDTYYLGNLPVDCHPAITRGEPDEAPTAETVRRTIAETRRRLGDSTRLFFPLLIGRNLRVLLDEDALPGAELIHRALRPYWPALWRLAVQGHDAATGEPMADVQPAHEAWAADHREL